MIHQQFKAITEHVHANGSQQLTTVVAKTKIFQPGSPVMEIQSQAHNIYITKAQAMAFFGLIEDNDFPLKG